MDKYEVIEGCGEEGLTLVHCETDQKKYVLRRIQLRRRTERCKQTVLKEMNLLSRIRNPFLVAYKEVWMGKGCTLYILMDYCEGGDMSDIIKKAKGSLFPEAKICKWFVQLLLALDLLHSKNAVHGNLKCSNIFLSTDQDIQLGNYGFVEFLKDDNSTSVGIPNHMCPEILADFPYGPKSDIWALGCCMFEITGHRPAFIASDISGLVSKIKRSSISALPSMYSPYLKSLIKSMLRKNPDQRPSAADLMKHPHLQKYVADCITPPLSIPCSSPLRSSPLRRTSRTSKQSLSPEINRCGSSLSTEKGSSRCSVMSREPSSTDVIECADNIISSQPISCSGNGDTPNTRNRITSGIWNEQECSIQKSPSSTNSPKSILLEPLPEDENSFQFPTCPPSVSFTEESTPIRFRDASTNIEFSHKNDHTKPSAATNYQERAEALESLLELCAQLLQQQKLEELAGVLMPFGMNGASPRETAIWLTKSMKAVGDKQHGGRGVSAQH